VRKQNLAGLGSRDIFRKETAEERGTGVELEDEYECGEASQVCQRARKIIRSYAELL
jgi:hypothetical protein